VSRPSPGVTGDGAAAEEPLLRQLSVAGIWLLAVNGMIGAGIFGVPAGAAALTGIYSPLVFLGCGFLLTAVVLCFAELASYFRGTGGPVLYLRSAFGPMAGFQAGWAFYIARATAFAANLNLLVASLAYLWTPAEGGHARILLMALVVGLLAWPNIAGTRHAMRSLGWLTLLKLVPLLAVVGVGATWLGPTAFAVASSPLPDYAGLRHGRPAGDLCLRRVGVGGRARRRGEQSGTRHAARADPGDGHGHGPVRADPGCCGSGTAGPRGLGAGAGRRRRSAVRAGRRGCF
jgi:amino acid transporter